MIAIYLLQNITWKQTFAILSQYTTNYTKQHA